MLLSTLTVTNVNDGGPGSFRAAIAAASGGDTIAFDRHLRGSTILLTGGELVINRSLDIEGPGSSRLTVEGAGNGRVFHVTAPGVNVTIAVLTIGGGRAPIGGGVLDEGASLALDGDVITDNQAVPANASTTAAGGAVAVTGVGASIRVDDSALTRNQARGGDNNTGGPNLADTLGGTATGGAILDSSFSGNQALGGAGGPGGTDFSNGQGGEADGGAIAVASDGTSVSIRDTTFAENEAVGGLGGQGGTGFLNGTGGEGSGGALSLAAASFPPTAGSLTVVDSSFADNVARGGEGGTGQGSVNG
jgi:hypothetical protein